MLAEVLTWLTRLSSTIYGGTLVAFAALLALYPRLADRPREEVARVFSAAGPILGLSMGAWVFALVAGRFARTGTITWSWGSTQEIVDLAAWIAFGLLWFSSFVLEIWTMHPIRPDQLVDGRGGASFDAGYRKTLAHLWVNAGLFVIWTVLWVAAQ